MKQAGDTMKYIASPNLVLEALVYLGARANSYDQAYLESRLTSKGYQDLSRFRQRYAPFAALRQQLDAQVHVPEAHLKGLFVDLVSIAQNTGGAYPLPCCFFAPAACQCSGDLEQFLASMARRTPAQIARDILVSFDLSHLLPPTADGCVELLQENLSTLSLTTRGRSALMKAYRHYGTTLEHVSQCLRPVVAALEEMRPTLQRLAEEYSAQIADTDLETYLRKESGFQLKDDVQYQLRPLLISPSANIFLLTWLPPAAKISSTAASCRTSCAISCRQMGPPRTTSSVACTSWATRPALISSAICWSTRPMDRSCQITSA